MKIRCCICEKKKYRGIDREVSLRDLSHIHDKDAFHNALNRYIQYLSIDEEEYTEENLATVFAFSSFINENFGKSEVIVYSSHPVSKKSTWTFLGIDLIDEHLKSILRSRIFSMKHKDVLNSNSLFYNIDFASSILEKYEELCLVYVYCISFG